MKRLFFSLIILLAPALVLAVPAPEPPINIQINVPANLRRVELNWEASPSAGALYRVYRSESAGNNGSVIADKLVATNYIDTNVNFGTIYYYRLASIDGTVVSALTAPLPISPNLEPPYNITASDTGQGGEIKLAWERPTLGLVLTYNIYRSANEKDLGGRIARELAAVEYYDKNLDNNTRYYYRLKSVDMNGREGAASQVVVISPSDAKPPAPPVMSGNFEKPDRAYLSWSAPPNEKNLSYILYRSTSPDLEGDRVIQTGDRSYRQYNLPLGATFYYGVAAIDGAGNVSKLSNQIKITVAVNNAIVNTPKASNLSAEGTVNSGEVLLRWRLPSDSRVSFARVYRSLSANGEPAQIANRISGSSYLDKLAVPGQRYYYTVRLVGKDGAEYQASDQVNAAAFDPANRSQGFTPTGPTIIRPAGPDNAASALAPEYAYGKPRLANLALEAALSNNLRRALIKKLGVKAVPRVLHRSLIKAYIYGGYTIDEIASTLTAGPGKVHPSIRAVEWRQSREYWRKK